MTHWERHFVNPDRGTTGAAHQRDEQHQLENWLVEICSLGGNACTFLTVAGHDGGQEPSIMPDSASPIG
jgi:hypothetical protein